MFAIERGINGRDRDREHLAWGEDVKIMAIRHGTVVELMLACAMTGRHLTDIDEYQEEKGAIRKIVRELAERYGFSISRPMTSRAEPSISP
jgi:S-adenosylmethionine synthetase